MSVPKKLSICIWKKNLLYCTAEYLDTRFAPPPMVL